MSILHWTDAFNPFAKFFFCLICAGIQTNVWLCVKGKLNPDAWRHKHNRRRNELFILRNNSHSLCLWRYGATSIDWVFVMLNEHIDYTEKTNKNRQTIKHNNTLYCVYCAMIMRRVDDVCQSNEIVVQFYCSAMHVSEVWEGKGRSELCETATTTTKLLNTEIVFNLSKT